MARQVVQVRPEICLVGRSAVGITSNVVYLIFRVYEVEIDDDLL